MSEKRFDKPLDFMLGLLESLGKSRNRQGKRQWSTSAVETYAELMELLDGTEQNIDFVKLYSKDKGSEEGASVSIQAALKAQIQFLAVFRRAYRMKLMVGATAREYSSIDHDRYAYNNGAIAIAKIKALKDSPTINPTDASISAATQENSDG